MADRRRFSVERRKGICAKRWRVESRDNPVTPWHIGSWTWGKIEDNRVGDEELLVIRSDKGCRKICRRLWYMSGDEK